MTAFSAAQEFIYELESLRLCLHPTDTLPGLAFDPRRDEALKRLLMFKGRSREKSFIGLVGSSQRALDFYAPLPLIWQQALGLLWPGPLSVIYEAADACPPALVAEDGSVALRVPCLAPQDAWFYSVLAGIDYPLPTTSVNLSGEPPCHLWHEAIALVATCQEIYVPPPCAAKGRMETDGGEDASRGQPSTLIKVTSDGGFVLLRRGLVEEKSINAALSAHNHS